MYNSCSLIRLILVISIILFTSSVEAFSGAVNTNYLFDNNVDRTKEEKKSDFLMVVSPKLGAQLTLGGASFNGRISAEYGRYIAKPDKDYLKQNILVALNTRKTAKYSFSGSVGYQKSLDVLGELGSNPKAVTTPDLWRSTLYDASVKYRIADSDTILKFSLSGLEKYYDLEISKIKDAKTQSFKFENSYRLSGKSRLFYHVKREVVQYQSKKNTQFDSLKMDYVFGVKTKTTGKLDAIATVGWRTKKITETGAQRYGGVIANIEITWNKKTYSRYKLLFLRDSRSDPITGSTNVIVNSLGIDWQFKFINKLITRLKYSASLNNFNSGNSDITRSIEPAASYLYKRWLDISSSIKWSSKSSSSMISEYDRYVIAVGLTMKYF